MSVKKKKQIEVWIGDYNGALALYVQCNLNPEIAHVLDALEIYKMINTEIKAKEKPTYIRSKRKEIKREIRKEMRFYLAGPISWVKDNSFIEWRDDISAFLIKLGHVPINPLKKYSVPATEKEKVEQMITSEWNERAREYLRRRIINLDVSLMEQSDAAIAYVPSYSVGTSSELFYFYEHNKPVYVVTTLPREQWSGWFVGLSTLIFTSWDELKEFLAHMEVGI